MTKKTIAACFAVVMFVLPTIAEWDSPTPDLIGCLKAIEPLDLRYSEWMRQQCVGVAGDISVATDQGTGNCLPELVGSMRSFYTDLLPLLPTTIAGSTIRMRGYDSALNRAASAFGDMSECAGLEGYEFTTCEYVQLSVATVDLLDCARFADVPLP